MINKKLVQVKKEGKINYPIIWGTENRFHNRQYQLKFPSYTLNINFYISTRK